MLPARILGTGSRLGARRVTTEEVAAAAGIRAEAVRQKTGIEARHWIADDETHASLATHAVRSALDAAGLAPRDLRRLILANSTGGDLHGPATANAVLHFLEIADTCDAFDIANACTGFLSALDIAARSVATGLGPVAIVAVETLSRFIRPEEPRPWVVFADAAGAAIIGEGRPGEGILSTALGNDPALRHLVTLAHAGLTGRREYFHFAASRDDIAEAAFSALERMARRVTDEAGVALADIEWVVPHQPTADMLDEIVRRLGIRPDAVVGVVDQIGSVASASMGVGLDRLYRTREVAAGDRILFLGVGAGLSYGAALYRVHAEGASHA